MHFRGRGRFRDPRYSLEGPGPNLALETEDVSDDRIRDYFRGMRGDQDNRNGEDRYDKKSNKNKNKNYSRKTTGGRIGTSARYPNSEKSGKRK